MIDSRIVERYHGLRALEASGNPHEVALARGRADQLEAAHGLGTVALRAFSPALLVRGRPWWCAAMLDGIGERLYEDGEIAG
jgi:hypothetical protein